MKSRSPLLGYNHNIRYAGRLYHVQTEDSGLSNPHVFTHLFFGGTILASKKLDYAPDAPEPAVQKLMQAQHKGMLKELRAGGLDSKIEKFFGAPVVRDAEDSLSGPVVLESADSLRSTLTSATPLAAPLIQHAETLLPPSQQPLEALASIPEIPVAPRAPLPSVIESVAAQRPQAITRELSAPSTAPRRSSAPPPPLPEAVREKLAAERAARQRSSPSVAAPAAAPPVVDRRAHGVPASVPSERSAPVVDRGASAQPQHPPAQPERPPAQLERPPARRSNDPRPNAATMPDLKPFVVPASALPPPAAPPRPAPSVMPQPQRPASPPYALKPTVEGVVVARPAVIVSDVVASRAPPQRRATPDPVPVPAPPPPREPVGENIFGGDLVSEKSLDEVILAYLAEDLLGK